MAERYRPSKEIDPEEFQQFESLMDKWYVGSVFSSFGHAQLESARPIFGMGKVSIPLLLASLANNPNRVILVNSALQYIEPELPFKADKKGKDGFIAAKVDDMRTGWLEWGVKKGLLVKEETPEL